MHTKKGPAGIAVLKIFPLVYLSDMQEMAFCLFPGPRKLCLAPTPRINISTDAYFIKNLIDNRLNFSAGFKLSAS